MISTVTEIAESILNQSLGFVSSTKKALQHKLNNEFTQMNNSVLLKCKGSLLTQAQKNQIARVKMNKENFAKLYGESRKWLTEKA